MYTLEAGGQGMLLAQPDMISSIDKYASEKLGIPTSELMLRAARAVAKAVRDNLKGGSRIAVFAGKGNNGGDGYAAAYLLMNDYQVVVYDVFSAGQRTEEGRFYLDAFLSAGGTVIPLTFNADTLDFIRRADCLIDAVFGTGFIGEYPDVAVRLAEIFTIATDVLKLAIDVPLGVNASSGSVDLSATYSADITVALGFIKPGLISYPAKKYVGKLIYDNIGLHNEAVMNEFHFNDYAIDHSLASSLIPERPDNSNKGTFGKLLLVTGSSDYPGAARLSLAAALRSGVGLTTYLGEKELCDTLAVSFPEVIYKPCSISDMDDEHADFVLTLAAKHSCVLLGSGSSVSSGLYTLLKKLLTTDGAPLVLDADAINVLAARGEESRALLRESYRTVILTPHPLELSRISGIAVDEIQSDRISVAKRFAAEYGCILVLKGAATVVTDGTKTYINTSGSSALAKAGSGDVLAGMLASVIASGTDPLSAAALSVYFHGLAADVLAAELSEFGVTSSDLPREIARQLQKVIASK